MKVVWDGNILIYTSNHIFREQMALVDFWAKLLTITVTTGLKSVWNKENIKKPLRKRK